MLKKTLTAAALLGGIAIPMALAAPTKPAHPAAAKPQVIAELVELKSIDKNQAQMAYSRANDNDKLYNAYVGMPGQLKDRYVTNANSVGALQFVLGGRVGINRDSIVEIVTERSAEDKTGTLKRIKVVKGGIWAHLSHQNEPVLIQTNGGVMGIKGTEFVVQDDPKGTSVGVLEGEVAYTSKDGKPYDVTAGQQYTTGSDGHTTQTRNGSPGELRDSLVNGFWKGFNGAIQIQNFISFWVPVPGRIQSGISTFGNAAGQVQQYATVVNDPAAALKGFLQQKGSELISNSPVGKFGINPLGGGGGKKKEEEPPFATDLSPDFSKDAKPENHPSSVSSMPSFRWHSVKDARRYQVIVGTGVNAEKQIEPVEWSGETGDTHIDYDSKARPLAAGNHIWQVIPLDDKGKALQGREVSQTNFEVSR